MAALHFPLYLCCITEMSWWKRSPCSLLTSPQYNGKKSRCENKKCIFSDISHPSCSYESITSYTSSVKFAASKFPRKPFEFTTPRSGVVNSTVVTLIPNVLPYFLEIRDPWWGHWALLLWSYDWRSLCFASCLHLLKLMAVVLCCLKKLCHHRQSI